MELSITFEITLPRTQPSSGGAIMSATKTRVRRIPPLRLRRRASKILDEAWLSSWPRRLWRRGGGYTRRNRVRKSTHEFPDEKGEDATSDGGDSGTGTYIQDHSCRRWPDWTFGLYLRRKSTTRPRTWNYCNPICNLRTDGKVPNKLKVMISVLISRTWTRI